MTARTRGWAIVIAVALVAGLVWWWTAASATDHARNGASRSAVEEQHEPTQSAPLADGDLAEGASVADARRAIDVERDFVARLGTRRFGDVVRLVAGRGGEVLDTFEVRCVNAQGGVRTAKADDIVALEDLGFGGVWIVSGEGCCPRWIANEVLRARIEAAGGDAPADVVVALAAALAIEVEATPSDLLPGRVGVTRLELRANAPLLLPNATSNRYANQRDAFDAFANFAGDLRALLANEVNDDERRAALERARATTWFEAAAETLAAIDGRFVEPWAVYSSGASGALALDFASAPAGFELEVVVDSDVRVDFEGAPTTRAGFPRNERAPFTLAVGEERRIRVAYASTAALTWQLPANGSQQDARLGLLARLGGRIASRSGVTTPNPDADGRTTVHDLRPGEYEFECMWLRDGVHEFHRTLLELHGGELLDLGVLGSSTANTLALSVRIVPAVATVAVGGAPELEGVGARIAIAFEPDTFALSPWRLLVRDGDVLTMSGLPLGGWSVASCELVDSANGSPRAGLRVPDVHFARGGIMDTRTDAELVIEVQLVRKLALEIEVPAAIARPNGWLRAWLLPHGTTEWIDAPAMTWAGDGAGGGTASVSFEVPFGRASVFTQLVNVDANGAVSDRHAALDVIDIGPDVEPRLRVTLEPAATLELRGAFLARAGLTQRFTQLGHEPWVSCLRFAEFEHWTANPFEGVREAGRGLVVHGLPADTEFTIDGTDVRVRSGASGSIVVCE